MDKCIVVDPEWCADQLCIYGEGDCDTVAQGEEGIDDGCDVSKGLVCGENNGADFGLPSSYEVCICADGMTWSDLMDKCVVVDPEWCADRLCSYGEGDCDTIAQGE